MTFAEVLDFLDIADRDAKDNPRPLNQLLPELVEQFERRGVDSRSLVMVDEVLFGGRKDS